MTILEELIEYRKKIKENNLTADDLKRLSTYIKTDDLKRENTESGVETGSNNISSFKTYVKAIPGYHKYHEDKQNGIFNQAGFSNAIFLSTITLICEITFLIMSFFLFK